MPTEFRLNSHYVPTKFPLRSDQIPTTLRPTPPLQVAGLAEAPANALIHSVLTVVMQRLFSTTPSSDGLQVVIPPEARAWSKNRTIILKAETTGGLPQRGERDPPHVPLPPRHVSRRLPRPAPALDVPQAGLLRGRLSHPPEQHQWSKNSNGWEDPWDEAANPARTTTDLRDYLGTTLTALAFFADR